MLMWTALTWIFVPIFASLYGLNGAAVGFTLVGLSSFVALYIGSKYVDIDFLHSVGKPLSATVIMGVVVFIVSSLITVSILQVILMIITAIAVYLPIIYLLEPNLLKMVKKVFLKQ